MKTLKSKALKEKAAVIFMVAALLLSGNNVYAKSTPVTKKQEFKTTDSNFHYELDEEISIDGRPYKLVDTEYKLLEEKEMELQPDYIDTVTDLLSKEEADGKFPKERTVDIGGENKQVVLKDIDFKTKRIANRTQTITKTVDYDLDIVSPSIAENQDVSFADPLTGEVLSRTIPLLRVETVRDWHWAGDITAALTVREYDSKYYSIGNSYFERNDEYPALYGKEQEILNTLGVSGDSYRVTGSRWAGDVYEGSGVQYRDITVGLQRYVSQFRAVYDGVISLPDMDGYEATANYFLKDRISSTEYIVEAIGSYEIIDKGITIEKIVMVVLPILLLAIVIALILFFVSKRKATRK